jgi:hypothetical protein
VEAVGAGWYGGGGMNCAVLHSSFEVMISMFGSFNTEPN